MLMLLMMRMPLEHVCLITFSWCSPMAKGGREVKRRLKSIRYIWSIITWPEKPQYSWNLDRNGIRKDTHFSPSAMSEVSGEPSFYFVILH